MLLISLKHAPNVLAVIVRTGASSAATGLSKEGSGSSADLWAGGKNANTIRSAIHSSTNAGGSTAKMYQVLALYPNSVTGRVGDVNAKQIPQERAQALTTKSTFSTANSQPDASTGVSQILLGLGHGQIFGSSQLLRPTG